MSKLSVSFLLLWLLSSAAAVWLYLENQSLTQALAGAAATPAPTSQAAAPAASQETRTRPWFFGQRRQEASSSPTPNTAENAASEPSKEETRAERRKRQQEQIAAFLGRGENESEEDYRARMSPMISMGLSEPRRILDEARKEAEEAANVTEEQRKKLDELFSSVYEDAVGLTNGAISDGELTPYKRNVPGFLSYAGNLGILLGDTQGKIDKIFSPEQLKILEEQGFDWSEYLGVHIPWETLNPPPPRR